VDDLHALIGWVEEFWAHLSSVAWTALGIAVGLHLLKITLRVRAWQSILRAAHPGVQVPFWGIFGAYFAGVGVNSVAPARGGDLVKLYLAKRRVKGSAYPTLASTLVVETIFDFFVAGALLVWAIKLGLLPGVPDLPRLPAFDWSFVVEHPRIATIVGCVLLAALVLGVAWASRHVLAFWERVKQGLAILRDPQAFLTQVVSWQLLSWVARVATVYWFLRAFHVEATLKTALAVIVVQSLSTLLPFTPGGVGTQQAVLLFVLSGVATSTAVLGFSVGTQLVTVAVNVAVGFGAILVMMRPLRWRQRVGARDEGLAPPEPAPASSRTALPG
jgi:uncharacterized membrane protein YbhN (UPF0104 family)